MRTIIEVTVGLDSLGSWPDLDVASRDFGRAVKRSIQEYLPEAEVLLIVGSTQKITVTCDDESADDGCTVKEIGILVNSTWERWSQAYECLLRR